MRSFVLFCLVPLVLGGVIPGQEKCTWGPTYWCSHVSHARECGATTHCLQTVWKNQIIKPESTKTCTYCELIVNEFRDVLKDKVTEDDIANILSNACAILPTTDYRDLCKGIVEEYTPELLQMFVNDVSTDMICAATGLCSGLGDKWSPYQVKASNATVCTDCTKFFKDVQDSITSQETVNQLTQLFNQTVCSQLGTFSETCVDLVKQYLPIVLQTLADQIDPDIVCRVFGFCAAEGTNSDVLKIKNIFQGRQSMEPLKYRSSEECELCKDLFNQIVATIRDKDNQDKIIDEAKKVVCDELGTLADQCKELVDEYAPMLFELLVNELDPTTVCEAVGLCQTPSLPQVILAAEVRPAGMVAEGKPAGMVGPGYVKDSTECTICKLLMQQLDNFLKENGTIKQVEDLIDKICDRLPSEDLQKQCTAFVAEYGPLVVKLTAQELDPIVFCDMLTLCKNGTMTQQQKADVKCTMCEEFVNAIEVALANVSTADLMNDLKAICAYIPGTYSATCLKYVNEYGPLVINLLKSKEDPHTLCLMGKMCTSARTPYMTKPIPELIPVASPSIECEVCDTVIIGVKSLLSDKATEEEVKEALEKVCSVVPSAFQSACKSFIDQYGDRIIQSLVKGLDANKICAELGLCKALKKPESQAVSVAVASPSIECEVCDTVIIGVKSLLSDKATEEEVKEALEKVCSIFPSAFQSTCKSFIDQYGDRIIQSLVKGLDANKICAELGLCKALKKPVSQAFSVVMSPYDTLPLFTPEENKKAVASPSTECQVCDTVIIMVKSLLSDKATEEEVEEALKKVCSEVPSAFTSACNNFIDQYGDRIIKWLVDDLDAKTICTKLGLCKALKEPVSQAVSIVMSPYDTLPLMTPEENKKGDEGSSVPCEACVYVLTFVEQEIQTNRTKEAIEAALKRVCTVIKTYKAECDDLVETYLPVLINYFLLEVVPGEICKKISLCSARIEKLPEPVNVKLLKDNSENTGVGNVITCEACKYVMSYVDNLLKGNRSRVAIEEALEKVCSLMPTSLQTACTDFVNQYSDEIINLIVKSLADPSTVCSELGLCSQKHVELKEDTGPVGAGTLCILCEFVMKELDSLLEKNASKQAIVSALDKVCSLMPDSISKECKNFVNEYTDLIISLLEQGLEPSRICKALKLCASELNDPFGAFVKILPEVRKEGTVKCEACELLVGQIKSYLKQNKTKKEIEDFLKEVCSFLPDTVTVQCDALMHTKLQEILDLLEKDVTPKQVCVDINACPARKNEDDKKDDDTLFFKPHPKLVGQKKCTFGPSYWCASKENAAECNAFEHCMNHVWN